VFPSCRPNNCRHSPPFFPSPDQTTPFPFLVLNSTCISLPPLRPIRAGYPQLRFFLNSSPPKHPGSSFCFVRASGNCRFPLYCYLKSGEVLSLETCPWLYFPPLMIFLFFKPLCGIPMNTSPQPPIDRILVVLIFSGTGVLASLLGMVDPVFPSLILASFTCLAPDLFHYPAF